MEVKARGAVNYIQIDYQNEIPGIGSLRRYDGLDGDSLYYIGANSDLEKLYDHFEKIGLVPRYDVHPLMNMNRSYGLEIRDGKFAIVTAEKLVENILKW